MKAHEIVSETLKELARHARPGIATMTLNNLADQLVHEMGGFSANYNYRPRWSNRRYPYAMCINVNSQIAHGYPNEYRLHSGDLVSLDMGVFKDDEAADAALTVGVGDISEKDELLLRYAKKALYAGIETLHDGVTIYEIARAIQNKAAERKFVVNHQLCGHCIGKAMHEEPAIMQVTNYIFDDQSRHAQLEEHYKTTLPAGRRICLEPMLTIKDKYGMLAGNGWTWETQDGSKSAVFEHMIEITKDGYKVLTTHIDKD